MTFGELKIGDQFRFNNLNTIFVKNEYRRYTKKDDPSYLGYTGDLVEVVKVKPLTFDELSIGDEFIWGINKIKFKKKSLYTATNKSSYFSFGLREEVERIEQMTIADLEIGDVFFDKSVNGKCMVINLGQPIEAVSLDGQSQGGLRYFQRDFPVHNVEKKIKPLTFGELKEGDQFKVDDSYPVYQKIHPFNNNVLMRNAVYFSNDDNGVMGGRNFEKDQPVKKV